ncbi:hypothetical protein [Photobacterium iliopiscarium]|uniref:hypothetical protein n=1 Tax=Photobacterium iliopiscarium TaxID=56192 RepID=UPI0024309303|nr:hypothetical protein [Photobacterium iliopiscarium]
MTDLVEISKSIHPSLVLTPLGWIFVLTVNIVGFRRAELSRIKDKITSQIEKLYADLEEKLSLRSCTESSLDDFLTTKITLIELRAEQFKKKSGYELISANLLSDMRSEPFTWLAETRDLKRSLMDFEYKVLEEVETNYSSWLFESWWKAAIRIFKDYWLGFVICFMSLCLYVYLNR